MLQRVRIEGIEFPRLYIAENTADVVKARDAGIPYIKWKWGMDSLIKSLLRPTLEKMFPGIKWNDVLGKRRPVRSQIVMTHGHKDDGEYDIADSYDADEMLRRQHEHDGIVDALHSRTDWKDEEYSRDVPIATDERDCLGGRVDYGIDGYETTISVADYIGDLSASVDIEALDKLGMLPKFIGDVKDCIRHNLSERIHWTEGYTKKLGLPLGNFDSKGILPNLLIVDISASIPDGIAGTMITLMDTLREQCNAELIITSWHSGYYPLDAELPKPDTIRDYYGRGNESREFWGIIQKYIAGREFGHVISFGDNDNPGTPDQHGVDMMGTKIHEVHHYHTWCDRLTGYAKWVEQVCPDAVEHLDTSWCKVMK